MEKPGFEIDKAGLEKLLERRGREFAVLELIQNALDERGVTCVDVRIERLDRSWVRLVVEDDAPDGFADLTHAYTLFAESRKKGDVEKRGRFNLGEKLVLACCRTAQIVTTSGGVAWRTRGSRWVRESLRARRSAGSEFSGEIRMTGPEVEAAIDAAHSVLVPDGVALGVDGVLVGRRTPVRVWTESLSTEVADAEGYLRRSTRVAEVRAYATRAGRTAFLYELGIPVVEIDGPFDVDVRQKVPLNVDRDNVTPAYLRAIRATVLNATHAEIAREEARGAWVDDALESGDLTAEAVVSVMTARYGERRVVRDPSDPESTKLAVAQGYSVIEPGAFSRDAWDTIRRTAAALPSGRVTPSSKVLFSADGDNIDYPRERWTPGMRWVVAFTRRLAERVTRARIHVGIVHSMQGFSACFGSGELLFNVRALGRDWFDRHPVEGRGDDCSPVLRLVIHELGHHYCDDHLDERYHDALCRIGAKVGQLGRDGVLEVFLDEARAESLSERLSEASTRVDASSD